jgi:hypothetical protein
MVGGAGSEMYPKSDNVDTAAVFTTSVTMLGRMRWTPPRRNRLNAHGNELQAANKIAEECL